MEKILFELRRRTFKSGNLMLWISLRIWELRFPSKVRGGSTEPQFFDSPDLDVAGEEVEAVGFPLSGI